MIIVLIFVSFFIGLSFKNSFIVWGIVIIALIVKTIRKNKKLSLIILGTFLFGFGISYINISYPNKTSYVGIVYEVKDNYFLFNSNGERLYCYEKNNRHEIGDILSIKAEKSKLDFGPIW